MSFLKYKLSKSLMWKMKWLFESVFCFRFSELLLTLVPSETKNHMDGSYYTFPGDHTTMIVMSAFYIVWQSTGQILINMWNA